MISRSIRRFMRLGPAGFGSAALLAALGFAAGGLWAAEVPPPGSEAHREKVKTAVEAARKATESATTDEKGLKDAARKKAAPLTHLVERGPFKVEVRLEGVFEAREMTEVAIRPRTWRELVVLEAVEQGARVSKGERLVTLELEKIDEAIRDLEVNEKLSAQAYKRLQEDVRLLEAALHVDRAASERAKRVADENLKIFKDVDRAWAEKSVNRSVKNLSQRLDYATEELRQLDKMYKADDLTEETEEIILKRQRNYVERLKFYLEHAKVSRDQTLSIYIPRTSDELTEKVRQQAIAWQRTRLLLPLTLNRKKLELDKMVYDRSKAVDKLEKLRTDRAAMTLRAPAAGVVYYGRCVRGRWTAVERSEASLHRGGTLKPNDVFITIVEPRPMFVRATIPEKELHYFRTSREGVGVPAAFPERKLPATFTAVSAIPVSKGNFDARISVELGEDTEPLMPGMSCVVKFVPYRRTDAVTVPDKAVFTDELDDEKHYVYLRKEDGAAEKRFVEIGKKAGGKTEVLRGLAEGDEVLLKRPDKKKKAQKKAQAPPTGPDAAARRTKPIKPSPTGAALRAGAAPPTAAVDRAMQRGIAFLLGSQNKDGSWGSARNSGPSMKMYDPVPGSHYAFRAAVTSLCVSALIECGGGDEKVRAAVDRAEAWMFSQLPRLRRTTPDVLYNNWSHAYAIHALARLHERLSDGDTRRKRIKKLLADQIGFLVRYESVDGGWGYYDFRARTQRPSSSSTCFMSATALVALHEAKRIGVAPPAKLVQRALDSIRRQQKPDFSYLYSEDLKWWPMLSINRPGGSLGRSQACNIALRLWGDERVTDGVLKTWLDRLVKRGGWLDMGRKRPIPHESWFSVAGYFFYYGHYYASLCIEQLKPSASAAYQDALARRLVQLQETDGSWWDYPLYDYHRPYGTAFALMSLVRCRRTAEASR